MKAKNYIKKKEFRKVLKYSKIQNSPGPKPRN